MRILLLNQVFYPDVAATAQHGHDLARHLVTHGHEVIAIASRSLYGQKGARLPKRETIDGIEIHRVGQSLFGKAGILARVLDFGLFYIAATLKAFTIRRPDVVICFTTPPFIALVGWLMRLLRGSKFVYWVMDLYPDLPVACGVMKPRSVVTRMFESINRFCLRQADRVVVLGRCMLDRVRRKGVDRGQAVHIGVWSDESEVKPLPRESNPYQQEWGLANRFVVMYSGNFGLGHDVDTMLGAAEKLLRDERIRFVFAGGGKKKEIVDRLVREMGLRNCVLAPYQPRARLDASLSVADVHLATLLEGVEGIMVPCKLFGIMAAQRPTIFVGHPDSELARVLTEHDAGLVVRQDDVAGLCAAITRLRDDVATRERMGRNARKALASAFNRERRCEQWRLLLQELVPEPEARGDFAGMIKYVFIQNDPFYLPKVLDKYLREFADTTAGVNIQSVAQGKRSVFQTAFDLYRVYGFWYFQRRLRQYLAAKIMGKIVNGWLGTTRRCYSVRAVAKKYGVEVTEAIDVNSEEFLKHLRDCKVDFIVSISGTQMYRKALREQTPRGIVNCHGALLPKYRGLMPSFWTACNNEREGGVSVHYVDAKLDNGPIIVQKRYRIHPHDSLEDIMARSKDLASEAIIECVRLIEAAGPNGPTTTPNDESHATHFSMPTQADVKKFRATGRRFF